MRTIKVSKPASHNDPSRTLSASHPEGLESSSVDNKKTLNGGGLFVDLLALLLDCLFLGRLLLDSYLFLGRLSRSYLLLSSRLLFPGSYLLLSSRLLFPGNYLLLSSRLLFPGNYLFLGRLLLDSYLFLGRLFRSYLLLSSRLLFLCSFFLYNHFHRSYFTLKSLSLTVF